MGSPLLAAAALAVTTSLTAAGLSPAAPSAGVSCGWRISAVHVLAETTGLDTPQAKWWHDTLVGVGADQPGFVPAECYSGADTGGGDTGTGDSGTGDSGTGTGGDSGGPGTGGGNDSGSGGGSGTGGGTGGGTSGSGGGKCTTTAAEKLGWGKPNAVDEFEGSEVSGDWNIYDGPGHAGNGTRTPEALSVSDGLLTITGSENGDAGGAAWSSNSQQYGRWEGCAQSPPGAGDLHTLFLLWPTAENWPEGGEVDFMEISDPARQEVGGFLHYGADNSQTEGTTQVDATQWNAFAVEWTPDKITYLVNGEPWFEDTDPAHNPPGPMHLTIQLDNFGGDLAGGAQMHVDWVRQYALDEGGSAGVGVSAGEDGVDADANVSSDAGSGSGGGSGGETGGSSDTGSGSSDGSQSGGGSSADSGGDSGGGGGSGGGPGGES